MQLNGHVQFECGGLITACTGIFSMDLINNFFVYHTHILITPTLYPPTSHALIIHTHNTKVEYFWGHNQFMYPVLMSHIWGT